MKLIIKNAVVFFAFPIVLISLSLPVFSACSGSPPQNMGILQPGIDFCWNNPAVCGLACPPDPCPSTDCTDYERKLATCENNLSTANGNLTSCNTEKGVLNTDLTNCNTEKVTLNTNLTTCNTEKGTLNVNLSQCRTDLAIMANTPCVCQPTPCPEKVQLAQCNTEKGTLNANLTNCNTNLVQCNAEKAQCQTDKNNCNTNLTQSNAEKAQCLTDKNNCNTNLTNCNTEKATLNSNWTNCNTEKGTLNTNLTNCNTEKGTLNTNLTNCNTEKATLNTTCNTEKETLNTNCNTEKDALNTKCNTERNTLTNTSCGTPEVPEPTQENHSSKKVHIPAIEFEGGVNEVYEVDMCQNEVKLDDEKSLTAFTFQSMKKFTTFFNNTAKALNIAPTSFDLVVKLNQPGEVYYVVKEKSAGQLTSDDYPTHKIIRTGENNQAIGSVKELKAGTSYTVYLVTDLNDIPTDLEKLKALEVTTVNE